MTQPYDNRDWNAERDVLRAELARFEKAINDAMKQAGFTKTLKSLKKGHLPSTDLMTVHGGVVEETMFGEYDAALDTDKGRVVLRSAQRTDRSADPQLVTSIIRQDDEATSDAESQNWTSDELLAALSDSSGKILPSMVCAIELTGFDHAQTKILLPLLWQYIVEHRDSNDRDELIAVGAAIRKYIAIMPMDQLGSLSVLLESGHRTPLPMELEIEIAKMVLRNCEVCPPAVANRFPELSQRLWELVQAYINPRVLLRDKHAAVTSLAIEAIVGLRSELSEQALEAAISCSYGWFAELVVDELNELASKWDKKSVEAADWIRQLVAGVTVTS